MTRQVSHNTPRNVKRRMKRDSQKLPLVEDRVDELETVLTDQTEALAAAMKQEPVK